MNNKTRFTQTPNHLIEEKDEIFIWDQEKKILNCKKTERWSEVAVQGKNL